MPRRQYAGTYDEAWQRERAPFLPLDFDPRFLQVAPASLIATRPLLGGEPVGLHGLVPEGPLGFALPRVPLVVAFTVDHTVVEQPAQLDTITFEPDARRFTMLWRAWTRCDKKALKVSEVRAALSGIA